MMTSGYVMKNYFFSFVKEHWAGGLITELYDEDDMVVLQAWILQRCATPFAPSCSPTYLCVCRENNVVQNCCNMCPINFIMWFRRCWKHLR